MKNIKVVIGANYGDEGKGLLTRHFAKEIAEKNEIPLVVFHNGTAQRGHTVDYNPESRHIYHHFNSGTADGAVTYFADTFWLHPMEFYREWQELNNRGIHPRCYCDPNAKVITPFDMVVDHATEAYITWEHQEPEHGSCGYGTWCATDREPYFTYTIGEYINFIKDNTIDIHLDHVFNHCCAQLILRGVDLDKIPQYIKYFTDSQVRETTKKHFIHDLQFMYSCMTFIPFDAAYHHYDNIIFENAQGLGLDQNCGSEWHTTSNTGILNPMTMLRGKDDFDAEIVYVSRSYATRHGIGPMEAEATKKEINEDMYDRTNITNEFQGNLRYGYPEDEEMKRRIDKDFILVKNNIHYHKSLAITHCNEFPNFNQDAVYLSNNPFTVFKR